PRPTLVNWGPCRKAYLGWSMTSGGNWLPLRFRRRVMMDAMRAGGTGGTQNATQGIEAVRDMAEQFREVLCRARLGIRNPGFEWYPYDTLSSLTHCNQLLRGANRAIFGPDGGGRKVLDLGCADGELGFFLESLGYQVTAVD